MKESSHIADHVFEAVLLGFVLSHSEKRCIAIELTSSKICLVSDLVCHLRVSLYTTAIMERIKISSETLIYLVIRNLLLATDKYYL